MKVYFVVCILLVSLVSCGGGEQLPTGSQVVINPSTVTWRIIPNLNDEDECLINPDLYVDEVFYIRVEDASGRAIGNADLIISLLLSDNTFSGFPIVELYDDLNGDLIPDPDELVSDADDSLLFTSTDEITGSKAVIVRLNVSCEWSPVIQASSSGLVARVPLDVIAEN